MWGSFGNAGTDPKPIGALSDEIARTTSDLPIWAYNVSGFEVKKDNPENMSSNE